MRCFVPWLLLDTAMPRAVVALVSGDEGSAAHDAVLACVLLDETRRHAEALPAAVGEVLRHAGIAPKDLVGVGVGRGPGSFIGVRTAMSYGLGLGRAVGCPVVGLDGLVALVGSAIDAESATGTYLAVVDAKRAERYVGRVHVDVATVRLLEPPGACAPDAIVVGDAVAVVGAVGEGLAPTRGFGAGVRVHALPGPTGTGMAWALRCADRTARARPVYVRDADAKKPSVDPAARRSAVLAALQVDDGGSGDP
jgi:tRNA threonylcarbamoyladenosine biosynthesis protein TsaB